MLTYHSPLATLRTSVISTSMLKTLKNAEKPTMSQTLKLRDADQKVREFINACRTANEEYVIQDDDDQTVAVVVPKEMYQLYQQEWEKDFAVVDRIREKMKGFDPDEIQASIDQAVEEVKAISRAKRERQAT